MDMELSGYPVTGYQSKAGHTMRYLAGCQISGQIAGRISGSAWYLVHPLIFVISFSFFAFHIHIILRECESINFKESEFIHQFLIFSSFDCEHFLTFDFSKDIHMKMLKKCLRSRSGYLIGYGLKKLGSGTGFSGGLDSDFFLWSDLDPFFHGV